MLRPATPLTILLLGAFGLLLISVISTPIIQAIPLGEYKDVRFGVFGYCRNNGQCSPIGIGYDRADLFPTEPNSFDLPIGVRETLSSILIVHVVAAFLTLVLFIMAAAAHFHSPAHSTKYLLILFIFTIIDFLVCLLALLIDVLLFIPHMAWGSYLVIAATVIVALSGVMSCFMRRTLVGRKSRQKRIAENAEMSGQNFYNREAQSKAAVTTTSEPTVPMVSGGNGTMDNLPTFASFESQKKDDSVSDERIPLTTRSPVNRSPNAPPAEMVNAGFNSPSRSGSRDRFGNPTNGGQDAYGMARGPGSRGRGNMGPPGGYRGGRGGYGRGGYDQGPPMRGRGGYGPPGRGGYGPRGGRGGYGPPPRGAPYGPGGMRGGRTPPPGNNYNMAVPYDRRPSQPEAYGAYRDQSSETSLGYNNGPSPNPSMPNINPTYEAYNPDTESLPRAESPPPLPGSGPDPSTIGRAVEMDAAAAEAPRGYGQYGQLRDSDADVAGMVNLQQGQIPNRHDTIMSEGSKYSTDEQYVPPRAAWNQGSGRNSPRGPSPLHAASRPAPAADNYYEDVDPRFAGPSNPAPQPPPIEPIYEDVHALHNGARSPAESERSNFTSISQRGVNPRWNPPPPMPQGPQRRQGQKRQDMLLDMPDFQLPGGPGGPAPRGGGGPGLIPGSAYPTGPL
ncbi:pH-response regulator protein palI/prr-5 [Paramyrothecium foliicola]|nr:pH-response regulator protein palI/prr-5 [Paramyrothecium foliicola]